MMVLKSFKAYALELFFAFEKPINISSTSVRTSRQVYNPIKDLNCNHNKKKSNQLGAQRGIHEKGAFNGNNNYNYNKTKIG